MVVLQQQEMIVGRVIAQLPLECERVAIVDPAEPANPQARTGGGGSGQRISASQSRVSRISWIRLRNAAA